MCCCGGVPGADHLSVCRSLEGSGVTSISSVLPVVSKLMDGMKTKSDSQLLPSLGLEKETTGALLLGRSPEAVETIVQLNRNNHVQRKYW